LNKVVAERGEPALSAGGADAFDLIVSVVEEGLQLITGERAAGGVGLGVLNVRGAVPLVHTVGVPGSCCRRSSDVDAGCFGEGREVVVGRRLPAVLQFGDLRGWP
jgi:hypothetical protein